MSRPVIQGFDVGKKYHLGTREHYTALRDVIASAVRSGSDKLLSMAQRKTQTPVIEREDNDVLWALKDVNFEVEEGQALGIIGRNGAGKSTLLKILSRVTEPTTGLIKMRGRLGSLLEVGTGFHPELTGRENIFLSGIILGMKRHEIARRFDEIVAFAEVEKFIDTPVRRYSSGMYVRLAFSVAAHMDVEVLLVDEVLAVGDASFQKRCLGKMDEAISSQGRTVLFVSHNLGAIKHLTSQCLLLSHGKLLTVGPTDDVVNLYLQETVNMDLGGSVDLTSADCRRGTSKRPDLGITFQNIKMMNDAGQTTNVFFEREAFNVNLTLKSKIKSNIIEVMILVMAFDGTVLFSAFKVDDTSGVRVGTFNTTCRFSPNLLRAGNYRIRLYIKSGHWQDVIPEAMTFKIESHPTEAHEMNYAATAPGLVGLIRSEYEWGSLESA